MPKQIGYAILNRKRLVKEDETNLCTLLVFRKKWQAENARKINEKIARVVIEIANEA